jgi:hypothetical protein
VSRTAKVTDRALRYRANQAMPADAPRVCFACGSSDVEVGHLDGHEENTGPENLAWTCRPCNVKCGNTLRAGGVGRLTNQYNPARNSTHYRNAVDTLLGRSRPLSLRSAIETIQGTSHAKRAEYITGKSNPGADSLGAYMSAIAEHRPGAHDRGGKVIHETPPARRSKFAREIARIKAERYGSGGVPDWVTNPARKRNPADAARGAFEDFHGYPSEAKTTVVRTIHEHDHVAAIGELIELWIVPLDQETPEGKKDRCIVLKDFDGAWLTQSEHKKRPQLFIDGGDQALDDSILEDCGVDLDAIHEVEVLGKGVQVTYYTDKTHLGKEGGQADYTHPFGETLDENDNRVFTGKASRPVIAYDTVNHMLFVIGGKYTIPPEGISN